MEVIAFIGILVAVLWLWLYFSNEDSSDPFDNYGKKPFKAKAGKLTDYPSKVKSLFSSPVPIVAPTDPVVQLHIFRENKKGYMDDFMWDSKRKTRLLFDSYTCQSCGIKGVPLDVHHKRYSALPNEPLTDIISVCRPCHKKLHKTFGFPSTYEDYMTFYGWPS